MVKNEKGMMLIVLYLVLGVLMLVVGVFAYRNIVEVKVAAQLKQRLLAFYSAEAAIDKAVAKLPSSTTSESNVDMSDASGATIGEYTYSISTLEIGKRWQVNAWGYYPDQANAVASSNLEAFVSKKDLPSTFWENAIYTAGNVRINGTAYDLDGDVRYGGSLVPGVLDPANFSGTAH
ncbi:MAG: hypothetical protein KAR20_10825, partial [Candidatus Heimdallarchaeota archaeon]|nr:hypothetical protein [Candidatus Heimdallarchaeota archaeon]